MGLLTGPYTVFVVRLELGMQECRLAFPSALSYLNFHVT
jgi:hypothetical protein